MTTALYKPLGREVPPMSVIERPMPIACAPFRSNASGLDPANQLLKIALSANRLLYKITRNSVATRLDIGRKRSAGGALEEMLFAKDRTRAGMIALADGLVLTSIRYRS